MRAKNLLIFIVISLVAVSSYAADFNLLKELLDDAGIPYIADDSKQVCVIKLEIAKETDGDMIFLKIEGNEKNFIVARLTLLDRDEGFDFPVAVYKECLEFNQRTGLLKAQYDPHYGDIDLTYEAWVTTPPDDVARGLQLLVENADVLTKKLKPLMKGK